MTLDRRKGRVEEDEEDDETWDDVMSGIREDNAEAIGVTTEEMENMSIREIEAKLDIETEDPYFPKGSAGGYPVTSNYPSRYSTMDAGGYQKIKKFIRELLA